jgi:hypothetical protein
MKRAPFDSQRVVLHGRPQRLSVAALLCGVARSTIERWAALSNDVTALAKRNALRRRRRARAAANGVNLNTLRSRIQRGWRGKVAVQPGRRPRAKAA